MPSSSPLKLPRALFRALAVVSLVGVGAAADSTTSTTSTTSTMPCTATATSGAYFDLRPDTAVELKDGASPKSGQSNTNYAARGWDYAANFTVNICAPVVDPVEDVVGVDSSLWRNVSGYYVQDGHTFSLGQESSKLVIRGKKLVLQYTGGSPCGAEAARKRDTTEVHDGAAYSSDVDFSLEGADTVATPSNDNNDDGQIQTGDPSDGGSSIAGEADDGRRRKSMAISFLCARDPTQNERLQMSFVGTDPDECAYFFEARSVHACATAEQHKPGSVGPGSVFAIIFFITVMVYVAGGVFYQRNVAHARGWRQLPNYSLWAGIWGFISDTFVAATSSCAGFLPTRRGYSALSSNGHRSREDENRLIDQLDEEWDD